MIDKVVGGTHWEQPLISIDVIAVQYNKELQQLRLLLGKRKFEPFIGEFALPGVLLLQSERVKEASYRALNSKVGITNPNMVEFLQDIGVSDNPDRDPRGATLSVVSLAIISENHVFENSEDIIWLNVPEYKDFKLPFDHKNLVHKALVELERAFFVDVELTKALLGSTFSTRDVANIYKALAGVTNAGIPELNSTNLARKIRLSGLVNEAETTPSSVETISSTTSSRGRGRPSVPWVWK